MKVLSSNHKNAYISSIQQPSSKSKFQNMIDFCKKNPKYVITTLCTASIIGWVMLSKNFSTSLDYETWEEWRNRFFDEGFAANSEFQNTMKEVEQRLRSSELKAVQEGIPPNLQEKIDIRRMQADAMYKLANTQEKMLRTLKTMLPSILGALTEHCKQLDFSGLLRVKEAENPLNWNCMYFDLPEVQQELKRDPNAIFWLSQGFEQLLLEDRCPELAPRVKRDFSCPKHALDLFTDQPFSEWTKAAGLRGIDKKYRALSRQHHPDAGGQEKDQQILNQALGTLKEWARRNGLQNPI